MTVPFGIKGETSTYRVYDCSSLRNLLKKFKIIKEEFYVGLDRKYWLPTTKKEIIKVDSISKGYVQGVVCLVAIKLNK